MLKSQLIKRTQIKEHFREKTVRVCAFNKLFACCNLERLSSDKIF
jgi:hypothetical protein